MPNIFNVKRPKDESEHACKAMSHHKAPTE